MNGSMKPWPEWGTIGPKLEPELGPGTDWNWDRKLLVGNSVPPKANSGTFRAVPTGTEWN